MDLSPLQKAVWRHYYKGAKKELRKNGGNLLNTYDHYLPGKSAHSPRPPLVWRGTKKPEIEHLGSEGKFASSWAIGSKKRTFVASSPRKAWLYAKEKPDSRIYGMTPSVLKRADAKVADQVGATSTNAPLRRGILKNEVRVLLKPKQGSSDLHPQWHPTPLGEIQRKEFAGLIPEGYSTPYVAVHHDSNRLADHTSAGGLLKKYEKESDSGGQSVERQYRSQGKSDVGVSKLERGGRITIPSKGIRPPEGSRLGKIIRSYSGGNGTLRSHLGGGSRDVVPDPYQVARKALRRHEIVHSLLQQRRGGAPDTVAKLAGEELTAYRKQLFGRKSPAKHLPVSRRIAKLVKGTIASTVAGKKNLGITKWFERTGYQASLDEARNRTERNPTEPQKKAGNYRKGSLSFQGIPVTLENPRGSIRRGVDDDGKPWSNEMHADYGYIPRTKGKDGDQVDVFLGPSHRSQLVVAVDQHKGDDFDETKFILGCDTREQAEKLYLAHYPKDWKLGPVSTCTIEQFKEWLSLSHPGRMGHMKQPFRSQRLKALTAALKGMKQFEKPFRGYNAKRHARTGGLNDSFREKYNRENGSNLKRPVTTKPSELKPGSKSAKRRESFCARMSGVSGPTSKDGKLTPKGAALKRWNCSALLQKVKEFSQTPEEERHELLKTGLLSTGLAAGLALGGRSLRGTVGAAEKVAIQRATASKIAGARRNARVAGEDRAAESAKTAKVAAKARYKAGNASFQNLARNPNLTKGEKAAVKRTHSIWKAVNPNKEFSSGERSGSEKLRDGAIGAGALAAGGGILHAGLKVGRAADEVTPTAKAIRAVLAHGEQAAGNLRKGWIGRILRLSAKNPTMNHFALKTDEDGVPLTGKTAHDRFVKTIREGDLDRRDRNINNAAGAGAAAGWLTHRKGATLNQRLGRLGLGAAAGMGGVLAIRAITDKHRDIYGDRPRWAKRAEALPTVAGVGAAGAILAKKAKLFARGDYVRKVVPKSIFVTLPASEAMLKKDVEKFAELQGIKVGNAHRQVSMLRKITAGAARRPKKEFASRPSENPGHQVLKAGLSGAASGALLGGGTALLTRGKSLKSALQAAGIGAGAMGALAGGGTAIGNKVLGNADPNDKAAFTKRAAVGGALSGAALGGLGAVALKKGMLGSKVSSAFAKGAKTWRPLHAIQTSGTPVAAAVGAGAGSLYGAHQGADEGMMVDAINNSKLASFGQNPNKKNLSAKIRGLIKEFGYSSQLREKDSQRYVSPTRAALGLHGDVVDSSGQAASLAGIQTARGFYNRAKGVHRWGGRGTGLLRDAGDVMAGKPRRVDQAGRPQKREWEKAWFHRTAGTAATAAAMLGGAALATKTKFGQQHILPQIKKVDAGTRKHGVSLFSSRLRRTLKQFDLDAALAGWDVRDPRGKSARVFAPGSRPRFRRQKEWHEKKENREALLKGAIVGTGLIGVAGGVAGGRKLAGLSVIPRMSKVAKAAPYPPMPRGATFGKFGGFVPNEHRGGNIADFPIKFRPSGAA
jgi:hypothetical protein